MTKESYSSFIEEDALEVGTPIKIYNLETGETIYGLYTGVSSTGLVLEYMTLEYPNDYGGVSRKTDSIHMNELGNLKITLLD